MSDLVRLDVDAGVGTIRLDRPPMNVLSAQMQDELATVAAEADARRDVRAVVVYGGPRIFAAGADVAEMAGWSPTDML
ncbi:MAG: enoyl-CoA hydratase/isomerase family protein, partial [Jiangellales bacterium]